jgi:hypothetical protein
MRSKSILALVPALLLATAVAVHAQEKWDKDIGKEAPRLFPAGWVGTPVSLDALRKSNANAPTEGEGATVARKAEISGGNTVVLAFWTADIPC